MVQLGRQNGMAAEIHSGLSEGDHVIRHPSDAIEEGVALQWE